MNQRSEPLVLDRLGMRYGTKQALEAVSVRVEAGRTLAVLGPSGCGKSTLLKIVAGLAEPTQGQVLLGERRLSAPGSVVSPERRGVSMVFQDYALWPHMRVDEIIGYGLRYGTNKVSARHRKQKVDELISMMQLDGLARRRPSELSGGQQQRVSIARALATEPELLLFDEPLSNLDAQLRLQMRHELGALLQKLGTTALYVTHDVGEAVALADEVLVLQDGQAVQHAPVEELVSKPANDWVAGLVGNRFSAVADDQGRLVLQTPERYTPGARVTLAVEPGSIMSTGETGAVAREEG